MESDLFEFLENLETVSTIFDVNNRRRPKIYRKRPNYFESFDETDFFRRYRLCKSSVLYLLEKIEHALEFPDNRNNSISPINQLLIALRFYATGNHLLAVADMGGISVATGRRIIKRVSAAIVTLRPEFVTFPNTREEQEKVKMEFYNIARFPNVLGCIDCTHVKIQSPGGDDAELFRNRKGYMSINVQTVASANLLINDVVARWPGSTHDSAIYQNSNTFRKFERGDYADSYLLGDSGYPLKEIIFLILAGCCAALSAAAVPCCPNNEILMPKGFCGTQKMTAINCTHGRMVLRDIILDGTKVSTQDSPNFVFVEDPDQYCVASMYRNNSDRSLGTVPVAVVCFEEITRTSDIETSGILTLISVFFLVITIAVYTYLPQLRDLQGLCYMCMCVSMALGFLSLGVLQLSPGFRGEICTVTGFLVYTWMMATFFWMNVICINVFRTVLDASHLKKTERKQYFFYSCYAWGCTLLFLTVTLVANFAEGEHWKPGFGNGSCWFNGRTETWIFFYGPVAVLIAANVSLFALSSFKLWRHTRKYEVNTLNVLKHKFLLSLKLFLVMGISWIFEIASFAHGEAHIIWKIMDTFNCLQGVIIFLLLVILRRRAMQGMASENVCLWFTRPLAEKLSPHDDSDDQQILGDDTVEVRLN